MRSNLAHLLSAQEPKDLTVGIIGLGYVGSALAFRCISSGYSIVGVDASLAAINNLQARIYRHVQDRSLSSSNSAQLSQDFSLLSKCQILILCLPTPIDKRGFPDLSHLEEGIRQTIPNLSENGTLVVLESTTYPGTTHDFLLPELEGAGLRLDRDFFLAYSPERVDPANLEFNLANTPKIVAGESDKSARAALTFYSSLVETVVEANSTQAAEFSKVLENAFRLVNISFINEMSRAANALGLNIWHIIDLAATKPFGFMKFSPSSGAGGHCIPVDPVYLKWTVERLGITLHTLNSALEVNKSQPKFIAQRIQGIISNTPRLQKSQLIRIGLLGMTYKSNVNDFRESSSLAVLQELETLGYQVIATDPAYRAMPQIISLADIRKQNPDVWVVLQAHKDYSSKDFLSFLGREVDAGKIVFDATGEFLDIATHCI